MELEHSAKGTTWGKHKYIRIENGRYIYSESQNKGSKKDSYSYGSGTSAAREATLAEVSSFLKNFKLTKGKGGKSSSKKSGSSKEKSEKKGSSKEKSEKKESTSKKSSSGSEKEEKLQTAASEGEKSVRTVDTEYNRYLEDVKKRIDNRSELDKVRKKATRPRRYSTIKHYGVFGQKWGKRNGPPYPLTPGDSNWNKSESYTKDFLNYIKDDLGKPEMVDDPELMELVVQEYEEYFGRKALK